MRWKAFFFENSDCNEDDGDSNNNFGFKSRKCPPQNEDLNNFEADVYNMIKNIEFRHIRDDFQDQLQEEDIKKINNSTKAFIPADKTANYYQIDKATHNKLLADNITTTYKKANDNTIINFNNEAKTIAANLNIDDRAECMAKRQAFITHWWWQGWPSGESTCLPPMWPGFDITRRHTWIEFVGSLLCYERFSPGYSGFPLSPKTNI